MRMLVWGCIASLPIVLLCSFAGKAPAQGQDFGKQLFVEKAQPPCALCHTLKAAGSTGEIGPNLDELKPDADKVRQAVKNGVGAMPPFGDSLSDAEIDAVAKYVAVAVGAAQ